MNMISQTSRGVMPADAQSERLDSDELVQLLRRNMWVILAIAMAVTGAAAAYLSTRTPIFRTQAAMVLTTSEVRMSQIDTQLQSYELTRTRVETELDVLRSRNFAEQVAKSIGLFQDPEFMPATPAGSATAAPAPDDARPNSGGVDPERGRQIIDKLLASYVLHRTGESLVITVQADATTPELAARIADGVVATFIQMSQSKQTALIDRLTFHLNKQITDMGEELAKRQIQIADFIRENALDGSERPDRLRRKEDYLASVLEIMTTEGRTDTPEAQTVVTDLDAVRQQLAARTRADLDLARMTTNNDLLATRHQTAIERLSDLERQRNLVQPDAQQITEAELPFDPAWPNFSSTLALAFPAGLVMAVVMTLLRGTMSQQVWDGAQVARASDLPNLGMVPHLPRRGLLLRRQTPARYLSGHVRSSYGEAVRSLVSIWSDGTADPMPTGVLLIASGLPGEGRTTIAVSMAITAAQEGMRALLLDMDAGNHGASRILGLTPAATSFGDMVAAGPQPGSAVQSVPGHKGLDLMAFQHGTQLTPRILNRFATQTLPHLRQHYDLIVIDSPPTLAIADAGRLGAIADEALLVVRAGKTSLRTLRSALNRLRIGGVRVAGVVINDVSARRYQQLNEGGNHG